MHALKYDQVATPPNGMAFTSSLAAGKSIGRSHHARHMMQLESSRLVLSYIAPLSNDDPCRSILAQTLNRHPTQRSAIEQPDFCCMRPLLNNHHYPPPQTLRSHPPHPHPRFHSPQSTPSSPSSQPPLSSPVVWPQRPPPRRHHRS